MKKKVLQRLPSVDAVLSTAEGKKWMNQHDRDFVVNGIRAVLNDIRSEIYKNKTKTFEEKQLSMKSLMEQIESHFIKKLTPSLRKAINATGVILHTGLGRAVMPKDAKDSINSITEGYCTLATDIETGQRGHRDIHLNDLLCDLTGAEAATVVNNNAAATMLILNTLARGKEVIVSRGQLVEIGGSFRMPDVMKTSGTILKEVGTTNKTHLKDYVSAINENTGAIMHVHHSNYRILGFAEEPSIQALAGLAQENNLLLIDDLGSGALIDLREFGLETEPLVQDSIKAGVDVACFSGDKLIGGSQAGIIVGKTSVVEQISKNPLTRALRVGKMTIAGLEASLRLFFNRDKLKHEHPVYRMFSLSMEELEKRAKRVLKTLKPQSADSAKISIIDGESQVGSGSVPVETISSKLLCVKPLILTSENFAKRLRYKDPPIFTRVHKDAVLFDFRTIQEEEDAIITDALLTILKEGKTDRG